jgi:hypothetical protein
MTDANKHAAMAQVLSELGCEIEALGEVLCLDAEFAARHVRQLQAIDLIAQKQRALAELIASGFSEEQVSRITIDTLRSRFGGFVDPRGAPGRGEIGGDLNLWN